MIKVLRFLIISLLFISCSKIKGEEDLSPWSITQVGLEYNATYKVQQLLPTPTGEWLFSDMQGPITVKFLNDSTATETHGNGLPVVRSFRLTGRIRYEKPEGYQYSLDFYDSSIPCSLDCPLVISAASNCVMFGQFQEIQLQKPSANYGDGFKLVRQ